MLILTEKISRHILILVLSQQCKQSLTLPVVPLDRNMRSLCSEPDTGPGLMCA